MIRQLATSTASATLRRGNLGHPISVVPADHERADEMYADVEVDAHLRVREEDNVLFPAVVRLHEQLSGVLS